MTFKINKKIEKKINKKIEKKIKKNIRDLIDHQRSEKAKYSGCTRR